MRLRIILLHGAVASLTLLYGSILLGLLIALVLILTYGCFLHGLILRLLHLLILYLLYRGLRRSLLHGLSLCIGGLRLLIALLLILAGGTLLGLVLLICDLTEQIYKLGLA